VPGFRARKIASEVNGHLCRHFLKTTFKQIIAVISQENVASQKVATNSRMRYVGQVHRNEIPHLIYVMK